MLDMYVLAIVEEPFVFVAGYAFKDELRKESNLIDLGHGKGYGLNQEQLREFK
jgi:hypothetical protein